MAGIASLSKGLQQADESISELRAALKGQPNWNQVLDTRLKEFEGYLQETIDEIPKGRDFSSEIEDLDKTLRRLREMVMSTAGGNANRDIRVNGLYVLTPFTDINLKAGSNVSISTVANQATKYMDMTITATGGSGSFSVMQPLSGVVNGSNTVFTWASAPSVIVVDQARVMVQTSIDTNPNWTGTTTTTLQIAPNFDIFAY